ncbi:MAG: PRC-barrel domain-containing protein [Spirochaetia bacterium]|nr:PRC-barrel domain-containing protein [Spirochaetia bacterium]
MLNSAKTLKGYSLKCIDGETGEVNEFYFDDRSWTIRYLVASTGTGSLKKKVLISESALREVTREDKNIYVKLLKKQVEDGPLHDTDKPASWKSEEAYYRFFGRPVYWGGPYMWGDHPFLKKETGKEEVNPETEKSWDPHLRETKYVTGYRIHAKNGEIGRVEDFILDDEAWAIRYLVINTGEWFADKKVIVSPGLIERVSFEERKVYLNITIESIKLAPEYTPETTPVRDYEERLHLHYKRQGYWRDEGEAHEG